MSTVMHSSPLGQSFSTSVPSTAASDTGTWRNAFRVKLYGLVAMAALLLILIQAYSIWGSYKRSVEDKVSEITSITDSATSILTYYANLAKDGKLTRDEAEKTAYAAMRAIRFGEDHDFLFAWRLSDAISVVHALAGQEGKNYFLTTVDPRSREAIAAERIAQIRAAGGRYVYQVQQVRPETNKPETKMNIQVLFEPWDLSVGTGVWLSDMEQDFHETLVKSIVIAVASTLLLIAVGIFIVRGVMRQLGGEPAGAVKVMQRAAGGDFTGTTKGKIIPGSLLAAFGEMSGAIRNMIVNVRDEAHSLKRDAGRLSESVEQVSSAASHQSEATASMAAAIEELTVSVGHISEAAIETERLSEGVATLCRNSESQVNSASDGMSRIASAVGEASIKIAGLEARAEQINVIAASIKEIASQTNLLALNAAIEAARAGEQGKGFSVVADEVRKLAERTASATIEIEQMVKAVQAETKDSTATMNRVPPIVAEGTSLTYQVAESLREIRSRADQTLERVREVANATREQSSASTSIAQRVEGIAQMVEETNASMEETARSASDMRDMSVRLDTLVGTFRV